MASTPHRKNRLVSENSEPNGKCDNCNNTLFLTAYDKQEDGNYLCPICEGVLTLIGNVPSMGRTKGTQVLR